MFKSDEEEGYAIDEMLDEDHERVIVVDNPSNLTLIPLSELQDFQKDLKKEPSPRAFKKLIDSILKHHVFIAKAVFYEDGIPYTEDGHQTMRALRYLRDAGYKRCRVFKYELKDGRMVPVAKEEYEEIMVPCQIVVPVGDTREERMRDAAEKVLQINSRYAEFNPETKFFDGLGFDQVKFDGLVSTIEIPELMIQHESSRGDPAGSFLDEFNRAKNGPVTYPIVPQYNEKYTAVIIVCRNETETIGVQTCLDLGTMIRYDKAKGQGTGMVLTAAQFFERWNNREAAPVLTKDDIALIDEIAGEEIERD